MFWGISDIEETNRDPTLHAVQRGLHKILNTSVIKNMPLTTSANSPPSAAFPTHRAYAIILIRHVDALCRRLIRFRSIDNPLLDVRGEAVESVFHVDIALCRDLHKRYA